MTTTYLDEIPEFPGDSGSDSVVNFDKRKPRMPRVLSGLVSEEESQGDQGGHKGSSHSEPQTRPEGNQPVQTQETYSEEVQESIAHSEGVKTSVPTKSTSGTRKILLIAAAALLLLVSVAVLKVGLKERSISKPNEAVENSSEVQKVEPSSPDMPSKISDSPWADEKIGQEEILSGTQEAEESNLEQAREDNIDAGNALIQKVFEKIESQPQELPGDSIVIDINDINDAARNLSSSSVDNHQQENVTQVGQAYSEAQLRGLVQEQLQQYLSTSRSSLIEDTSEFQELKNNVGILQNDRVQMSASIAEQNGQIQLSQRAIAEVAGTINQVKMHISALRKEASVLRGRLEANIERTEAARHAYRGQKISTQQPSASQYVGENNTAGTRAAVSRKAAITQSEPSLERPKKSAISSIGTVSTPTASVQPLVIANFRVEFMGSRAATFKHVQTGRSLLAAPGQSIRGLGRIDRLDQEAATIYLTLEDGRKAMIKPSEKLRSYAEN